jgi:hypothetical protein
MSAFSAFRSAGFRQPRRAAQGIVRRHGTNALASNPPSADIEIRK